MKDRRGELLVVDAVAFNNKAFGIVVKPASRGFTQEELQELATALEEPMTIMFDQVFRELGYLSPLKEGELPK